MLDWKKTLLLAVFLVSPCLGLSSIPKMKTILMTDESVETSAQFNTALAYFGKQDFPTAVIWFRKAAQNGLAVAQYNLAVSYDLGIGVEQDIEKAVFWYRKAAEQNDSDAQVMLAACLHNGEGVEKNFEEAAEWFKRAAELGSAEAQYQTALYYIEGRSVPRDFVRAYAFLNLAEAQSDARAKELKAALAGKMTEEQIIEAQLLCRVSYGY